MAFLPEMEPYSEMVAFGYFFSPAHLPCGGKVEHVRATFSSVQVQSCPLQMPWSDSEEQARYGFSVS